MTPTLRLVWKPGSSVCEATSSSSSSSRGFLSRRLECCNDNDLEVASYIPCKPAMISMSDGTEREMGGAYSSRVLTFSIASTGVCTTTGRTLHGAIRSVSFLAEDQERLADKRTHVSLLMTMITSFEDTWKELDEAVIK